MQITTCGSNCLADYYTPHNPPCRLLHTTQSTLQITTQNTNYYAPHTPPSPLRTGAPLWTPPPAFPPTSPRRRSLAKRREGGQVVEVEHLLFHARDARGCRVLPSLLECGSTKEIVAQDCGRWLAHPPVTAGGAGGSRRVDHVQAIRITPDQVSAFNQRACPRPRTRG